MSDNITTMFLASLQEKYAKKTAKSDDGKGMDPVGAEDGDIDNDGDSDESDAYLAKRRKAVGKAIKGQQDEASCGKKMRKEEVNEGVLGALAGGAIGNAVGRKFADTLASKGGDAAAALAGKAGAGFVKRTMARKAGEVVAKAAPTVAGAVIGDKLTDRRKKNESVEDYESFTPLNEEEQLFFEENQELVYEATAMFIKENEIDWESLTEEELNELLGRMARAIGRGVKRQTIDRVTTSGRADRAERKAAAAEKKNQSAQRLKDAQARIKAAKDKKREISGPSTADKARAAAKAGAAKVKAGAKKLMQ